MPGVGQKRRRMGIMANQTIYLGKLVPELIEVIQRRYNMLLAIGYLQPIGRRTLAEKLAISERTVRNDVEIFRQQELILPDLKGMSLSPLGEMLIDELRELIHSLRGLTTLETSLAQYLGVKEVVVIPGDIDSDPLAFEELGRVSAYHLNTKIKIAKTVAVAGGKTLACLADHIISQDRKDLIVLPARGGLGEQVEIQANTIAAKIAKKLGAHYRLLHVPDYMSQSSAQQLSSDPYFAPIIELIRQSDALVHGIGDALQMAERRGMAREELDALKDKGAKGEAFGYYFNSQGEIIYSTPSIGLKLDNLGKINTVMAIAGGKEKAPAIKAVTKAGFIDILVTDEGAARELVASESYEW